MRKVITSIAIFLFSSFALCQTHPHIEDCTYIATYDYGMVSETVSIALWGEVQIVKNPKECDLLVYVTKNFGEAQLYVRVVDSPKKANDCGLWCFVDKNPYFKIYLLPESRQGEADVVVYFTDPKDPKDEPGCRY